MKHGKKYLEVKKLVTVNKVYPIAEAIGLAKKTAYTKFDPSIELAIKLNVDTTKPEQQLRGAVALPHYFGKTQRILVLSDDITTAQAKEVGIDYLGGKDRIDEIKGGWLDFDLIITSPKYMPELSKLGKVLGPKGLMPNPKLGTVTPDVLKAAIEFKKGKVNYRTDTYGNIHVVIGKASAAVEKIDANIKFFLNFIAAKRPSTVKGEFIQKAYICCSMGPSIKIQFNNLG